MFMRDEAVSLAAVPILANAAGAGTNSAANVCEASSIVEATATIEATIFIEKIKKFVGRVSRPIQSQFEIDAGK